MTKFVDNPRFSVDNPPDIVYKTRLLPAPFRLITCGINLDKNLLTLKTDRNQKENLDNLNFIHGALGI